MTNIDKEMLEKLSPANIAIILAILDLVQALISMQLEKKN